VDIVLIVLENQITKKEKTMSDPVNKPEDADRLDVPQWQLKIIPTKDNSARARINRANLLLQQIVEELGPVTTGQAEGSDAVDYRQRLDIEGFFGDLLQARRSRILT